MLVSFSNQLRLLPESSEDWLLGEELTQSGLSSGAAEKAIKLCVFIWARVQRPWTILLPFFFGRSEGIILDY